MTPRQELSGLVALVVVVCLLPACGADNERADGDRRATPAPKVLEGMFDVGDHELNLRCDGSGSPTVVYLHGLSHTDDSGEANGASAATLPDLIAPKQRFCAYDRANVGQSDDVAGPLSAKTSARDLERLLDAAELEPPYVLLGASFGGLVAEVFAAENPTKVAGMLLLDAGFPDELDLEKFYPKSDRLGHGKDHPVSGWADTHELIDELAAYEDAQKAIDQTPSIPMTYLLADPPSYDGPGGYAEAYPKELAEFANRYSPGVVKKVPSDHYMEAAVPDRIVEELEKLITGLA
jgi:pimeloyl-ACP methyl ester carboxylesterase